MIKFDKTQHIYTNKNKELISVTQLMKKHSLGVSYDFVPQEILKKKAERGTLIHEEIEAYIKSGEIGFTKELQSFIKLKEDNELKDLEAEKVVYNDIVAGTIDLIGTINNNIFIADHKTTSVIHFESVAWQLSIYSYLLDKDNYDNINTYVIWYKEDNAELKEINKKKKEEIERLLECERNNQEFKQILFLKNEEIQEVQALQKLIINIDEEKKKIEEKMQFLKDNIMDKMKEHGAKKIDLGDILITLKDSTTRESVDTKKLKELYKNIYDECKKISKIKESLLITLRKDTE